MLAFLARRMSLLVQCHPRKGCFAIEWARWEAYQGKLQSLLEQHRDKRIGVGKQRAVIARMLLGSDILCPTTGWCRKQGWIFAKLMHHSAHQHGKAVLMITARSEKSANMPDRNTIRSVIRLTLALFQCVHEKADNGQWGESCFNLFPMIWRSIFLAVIAMSLFSPILGTFLDLRRQSHEWHARHVSLAGSHVWFGLSPTRQRLSSSQQSSDICDYLRAHFMEIGTALFHAQQVCMHFFDCQVSKGKSSSSMGLTSIYLGST